MAVCRNAMWAEQSSFCASGRRLRLANWCTCMQTLSPRWRPILRRARGLWCQTCPLWCFGSRSRREGPGGGGRGGVLTHACTKCVMDIKINNGVRVCGEGGGATALAGTDLTSCQELVGVSTLILLAACGRGAVSVCKHADFHGNVQCLHLRGGACPFPPSLCPPLGCA